MIYIIFAIVGFLIGFMVSLAITTFYVRDHTYGTLKQATDGEETYLFLDLDKPPEKIMQEEWVFFKVDNKKIGPHD